MATWEKQSVSRVQSDIVAYKGATSTYFDYKAKAQQQTTKRKKSFVRTPSVVMNRFRPKKASAERVLSKSNDSGISEGVISKIQTAPPKLPTVDLPIAFTNVRHFLI